MKITKIDNDFFVDGKETEFNAIPWGSLTEAEFADSIQYLNSFQKTQAERKRGAKQVTKVDVKPLTPEAQREQLWKALCAIPAGEIFAKGPAFVEKSPEWWFHYFWMQAKESKKLSSINDQDKAILMGFFDKAFKKIDYPQAWKGKGAIELIKPLRDTMKDADIKTVLEVCLKYGFDFVTVNDDNMTVNDTSDFDLLYTLETPKDHNHWRIGWRAEDWRTFKRLRETGYDAQMNDEYKEKAGDLHWAEKCNTRQPWHPFSDPNNRRKMFYRHAQTDNCLYSVVSLATSWQASSCYPKFDQTAWMKSIGEKFRAGTLDQFSAEEKKYLGIVRFSPLSPINERLMMVTSSQIALVSIGSLVFNTMKAQEKISNTKGYPEFGVMKVPGKNVLAMIKVIRLHHHNPAVHGSAPNDESGFTVLWSPFGQTEPNIADIIAEFPDRKAKDEFKMKIDNEYAKARSQILARPTLRWLQTGYEEIKPSPLVDQSGNTRPVSAITSIKVDGKQIFSGL
jgi:hypothetical protein